MKRAVFFSLICLWTFNSLTFASSANTIEISDVPSVQSISSTAAAAVKQESWYEHLQETWPGHPQRQKLGHGTFGTVYLVFDPKRKRSYAKKSIPLVDYVDHETEVMRLLPSHPNMVRLVASYADKTHHHLILEYCPGGVLKNKIDGTFGMPEDQTRFYLAQVVSAMREMQIRRIAYRDLKLNNIMLDAKGRVKLVDFGLAMPMLKDSLGKFFPCDHLAPELIKGPSHNETCDLWSLGLLAFEMLTNYRPERFSALHATASQLSPAAKDFIAKLVQVVPHERLGAHDFSQVQSHIFFQGVDWQRVPYMTWEEFVQG